VKTCGVPDTETAPQTGYAPVNGLQMYYEIHGAGGIPLLLLHGGLFNIDLQFGPLIPGLAATRQVIAADFQGHGSSTLEPADNTFDRHARMPNDAIAQAADQLGADGVFLVGQSIGGMIAMMIAAGEPGFPLIGMSVTGIGAVIRRAGPAEALAASLPADANVDLPDDQRDQVNFGPDFTRTPEGVAAARRSYAPVPVRELIQSAQWPDAYLPSVAPRVRVPVHYVLAEFDAVWDSTPATVERFAKLLTAAPYVDASIAGSTGHSIGHHTLGHALHLRQLAFAEECALWAPHPGRTGGGEVPSQAARTAMPGYSSTKPNSS
jgi:pimeloyl-ACP methyl ester carboxylesterase